MGHGIVCHLDHAHASTVDDALAAAFIEVVGSDTYPSGGIAPRSVGPWTVAGAWHSSSDVTLSVGASAVTETLAPAVDTGEFSPCHGAAGEARRTQEVLRDTHAAPALAAGDDIAEMLWGPTPWMTRRRRSGGSTRAA